MVAETLWASWELQPPSAKYQSSKHTLTLTEDLSIELNRSRKLSAKHMGEDVFDVDLNNGNSGLDWGSDQRFPCPQVSRPPDFPNLKIPDLWVRWIGEGSSCMRHGFIPWCVGRGARLGSESSSGRRVEIFCRSGNPEIWDPNNPKNKSQNQNPRRQKCWQGLDYY